MLKTTHWFAAVPALLLATGCGGERANEARQPGRSVAAAPVTASDARAQIFVAKGCPQCHSISGLDITSPTEVGPDLTYAEDDVESRFGMELEEFLRNPTGTMMVVLSSQIQLSEAERDSIVRILKSLAADGARTGR